MGERRSLGRRFGWLWGAYAVSTLGTWLAFDAFRLIAILVLGAGAAQVSLLAAAGLAVGAVAAVPLGPWVEFRRKRPVMIAMDLVRCGALLTVPAAYALDLLTFGQLVAVSVVVGAADITFGAASGAYLKELVPKRDLLVANGRFESTTWTASVVGPPLGGAAIGLFGPVLTVIADAVRFLLSALGLRAIGGKDPLPAHARAAQRIRRGELLDGWRFILSDPALRPLFLNAVLNNGLIMAASPLLAVLMLGDLGFAPWQYGLAFAVPCVGGLIGSRLAQPLVTRFGQHRVLLTAGTLRACWPVGLAFVGPGVPGLALVMAVEFGLILSCGVFNPVLATYRLERIPKDRVARILSAWSVSTKAAIAALTGVWGLLAAVMGPRPAIAAAGVLLLATPLFLPHREHGLEPSTSPSPSPSPPPDERSPEEAAESQA
ncbi:MFS transporter [Actinomycetota bacterium Odt1-20B]